MFARDIPGILCGCMLGCIFLAGCRDAPPPQLEAVQGTLLDENDRPLANYGIVLHSLVSGSMRNGQADAQGKVTLKCRKGKYKVTLNLPPKAPPPPPDKTDDKKNDKKMNQIETVEHPYPQYRNADSTPWTLDVPEGGLPGFVLKIKSD
ncbi:MAG: carboxypeptidase regulatory-like domain-containing protein [Planctomycetes bacterium]|nr:carboxypeptidase regulatory-like domain-containing protein [Planctomycetota bacterium]